MKSYKFVVYDDGRTELREQNGYVKNMMSPIIRRKNNRSMEISLSATSEESAQRVGAEFLFDLARVLFKWKLK